MFDGAPSEDQTDGNCDTYLCLNHSRMTSVVFQDYNCLKIINNYLKTDYESMKKNRITIMIVIIMRIFLIFPKMQKNRTVIKKGGLICTVLNNNIISIDTTYGALVISC